MLSLYDPPGFHIRRQLLDRPSLRFRQQLLVHILGRTRTAVPHDSLVHPSRSDRLKHQVIWRVGLHNPIPPGRIASTNQNLQ